MIDMSDDGHVADVLHIALLNLGAKIVQIERLAKQLVVFLLKYPFRWPMTGRCAVTSAILKNFSVFACFYSHYFIYLQRITFL